MVGCSDVDAEPLVAPRASGVGVEAAFRAALIASVGSLAVGERNLLQFRFARRLPVGQLAEMLGESRSTMERQLGRIRERVLRELRHQLGQRLALDRRRLDELCELARGRFDHAMARLLGG